MHIIGRGCQHNLGALVFQFGIAPACFEAFDSMKPTLKTHTKFSRILSITTLAGVLCCYVIGIAGEGAVDVCLSV